MEFRLAKLRQGLSPLQKELLNEFWNHYLQIGKWPIARAIYSQRGKDLVKNTLNDLGGDVVLEGQENSSIRHFELTIIGVLLTKSGDDYFELLVKYLEYLRSQFKEAPEKLNFTADDFQRALKLSDDQVKILGELVRMGRLWNGGGYGTDSWNVQAPTEVEDFPENGPLDQALEELLFRWFQADRPVSIEDRQNITGSTVLFHPSKIEAEVTPTQLPITVDALKRRYQVFVSSTYEDLKDERQHVIQALLETKCIPLGMELFPAASIEQWQLIRRIIDECDYYVVIVAGRYGSIGESGIGYTEMEFDYALSIGKPVIGFYHKNPDSLPGTKLEKNDAGRKRLEAFAHKVKQKLCRPWSSSAELGSAVKSAILHELEFNPKPGWIRADAVPNSDAVEKLKQKIADLEEKLKKRNTPSTTSFPEGVDSITLSLKVSYDFDEISWRYRKAKKNFDLEYETTWDKILLMLKAELRSETGSRKIRESITRQITKLLELKISQSFKKENPDFITSLDSPPLDIILQTFMAKKLVSCRMGNDEHHYEDVFWKFTAKGLQHLAELEAIRIST